MITKPINYHLVGFAYVGKTTLAKKLEANYDFARISIDEIKWAQGYSNVGDDDVPNQVWDDVFAQADSMLVDYLKQGKNVANEYAWTSKYWRDRSKAIAAFSGFETIFIHLQLPEQEIRRRWKENSQSRVRFHMPENEFERMFGEFEPLSEDEKCLVYNASSNIDIWVKNHLIPH